MRNTNLRFICFIAVICLTVINNAFAQAYSNSSYKAVRAITSAEGASVVSLLKAKKSIKYFCSVCGDKIAKDIVINKIEAKPPYEGGAYYVNINDKQSVNLANIYFSLDDNTLRWKNVAYYLNYDKKFNLEDVFEYIDEEKTSSIKANIDVSKIRWEPVLPTEDQFFTSYQLAIAERRSEEDNIGFATETVGVGRGRGRYGILIKDIPLNTEQVNVKFTFQADGLAESQTFEETLKKANNTDAVFFPPIVWDLQALRNVNNSYSTNFRFTVSINGQNERKQNLVVRVRPLSEALYGRVYVDDLGNKKFASSKWIFGVYVNEDHPWIDKLLKEALDTGLVNSFSGYQGRSDEAVLKQLAAIWYMLQKRGFKYSSITDTSNSTRFYFSQTVRFLDESINTSQANCVDGSVLWVSILRKIGIRAFLILVPGHCYIAIDMDGSGKKLIGLETTMMGNVNLKKIEQNKELMEKLGEGGIDKVAIQSFLEAVDYGTKEFNEASDKLRSIDSKNPAYQFVDIEDIRRRKFYPIR
jgi:hypothetical protein